MKRILFIPFLILTTLYCSSPTENTGTINPNIPPPIITGIYITNDGGHLLGTWGNPSGQIRLSPILSSLNQDSLKVFSLKKTYGTMGIEDTIPKLDIFSLPYPNPFRKHCTLAYIIPEASVVSIWIAPAKNINGITDNSLISGAFVKPENWIKSLIKKRELYPGEYRITFEMVDYDERELPSGFYRVYFKINESLFWRDIWHFQHPDELPKELRIFAGNY